jgi:hypothetical protein
MVDNAGTLERIANELASALKPLEQHLSQEGVQAFIAGLGLRLPPSLAADAQLASAIATAATSAAGLGPLILALTNAIAADDAAQIISAGGALLAKITELVNALEQIGSALNAAADGAGLTPTQVAQVQTFAGALARKLFDFVVIEYLASKARGVVPTLAVAGLVDDEDAPGDPNDPLSPPYRKRALHLDRVVNLILNPQQYLRDAFGFGNPAFEGSQVFAKVQAFLDDVDLPSMLLTPPGQPAILEAFFFRLSIDPTTSPPALTVRLHLPAIQDFEQTYPLGGIWNLDLSAKARFDVGLDITIKPPFNLALHPPSGSVSVDVELGVAAQHAGGTVILFAEGGGTKLEAQKLVFTLGFQATWDAASGVARGQPSISGGVNGGKLTIDLSSGDGFITTLLSSAKLAANLDFKMLWSPRTGFQIEGSSAFEIAIPTHVTLGPIEIQTLYLKLGLASDGSLPAELSSAFKASLGPLTASVNRIGLTVKTTFPDHGGNLGPANLALAFKPPSGVGLAVDAGIVKGGGFLYIDTDRGEYVGALELVFADFLSLHAIGLITTRMPDGSSGFSLLIIITADFGAGIQLGFGFTLLAVGGLLGLNRVLLLRPLMDGVRTGAINSILFPQNVVGNASRIISDLRAIFPPQQGIFLIGPMARLGWGEPTLINIELGIIIEIPGDIAIILGVIKIALPTDEEALIVIQVSFAGAIEFDKQRMYFFASLFDSRVLYITIEGEMGVLFAFGANANFVITVGGFHPRYNPPPLPFPSPRPIHVDLINESYARIRCDGYFAVTSETVQFGARAEFFFGFDELNVKGHAGFDALFQFSPFRFIVSISTSFSVEVFGLGLFGVDINLTLEGPAPWHAHGTASLDFFFFSIDIGIDFTWGDSRDTLLPPIQVMPLLTAEFSKQSNWRAALPDGSHLLVSLRQLDPAESDFVLHPVGNLRISQREVPLDFTLDKVGNQKPSDANRFALTVASGGLTKARNLPEQFASAQFKNYDDAAKLSLPAYAPLDGGIELSAEGTSLASGTAITRVVRYDLTIIDTKYRRSRKRFFTLVGSLFAHFLGGASVTRSSLSAYRAAQVQPFAEKVMVGPETFAVALQSNNTVYRAEAASFTSQEAARDYLNRAVANDPSLAGTLHVLPQFEVAV